MDMTRVAAFFTDEPTVTRTAIQKAAGVQGVLIRAFDRLCYGNGDVQVKERSDGAVSCPSPYRRMPAMNGLEGRPLAYGLPFNASRAGARFCDSDETFAVRGPAPKHGTIVPEPGKPAEPHFIGISAGCP